MKSNTIILLLGQVARLALQAIYFILAARMLGVASFGAFSGALALIGIITPFASLGVRNLLIRGVARNPGRASQETSTAFAVLGLGGLAATTIILLIHPLAGPPGTAVTALLLIASAEIIGTKAIDLCGAAHAAQERVVRAAAYPTVLALSRSGAAVTLMYAGNGQVSIEGWAQLHCASTFAVALPLVLLELRSQGVAKPALREFRHQWRDGLLFSISQSSQTVYNDTDKILLTKLSTLDATGIYSAAYRIIDICTAPMRALLTAAYPRFFVHGAQGIRGSAALARRLGRPSLVANILIGIAILFAAPMIPWILGDDYAESVHVIQALAVIPTLRGIHYLAADALTGADHQGVRSAIQIAVAAFNVLLNIALIPMYGYWAAVGVSVASDTLLVILMLLAVWRYQVRASEA